VRAGIEEIGLDNNPRVGIAFTWHGDPEHSQLKVAGEAIVAALAPLAERIKLLLLMIDGDVGKTSAESCIASCIGRAKSSPSTAWSYRSSIMSTLAN